MKNPKQSIGRTSSHKTSSSAANPLNPNIPKSFYESSKNPPSKIPPPSNPDVPGPSIPPPPPPPPPPYSFHNLDRRTIFLADGTIRSYFALPPDYQSDHNFFHSSRPQQPFDPFEGPGGSSSLKRKYGEEEFVRQQQRQQQQQQRPVGVGEEGRVSKQVKLGGVDEKGLKDAFLRLSKSVNEGLGLNKKGGLEDGKSGPLHCVVCGRGGKEFADAHGLILHAYNSQNSDLRIDHLGLHKALCVMLGWNYAKAPDNSKDYQSLSADDARENREDLILWPPAVIIHNTSTGKRKDGRMDGLGNKEMDVKLKELGFGGGKAKSVYGKEGHLGFTAVKFSNTEASFREAENLAEYFEKDNRGRRGWARVQASQSGNNDEKNPDLVKVDKKTGEKNRVFYGYLATVMDLDKVDFDMRKKVVIKSRKELDFD